MIKITEGFSCERDAYCWHLHRSYVGKARDGTDKVQTKTTYYASFEHILLQVLDYKLGDCSSVEQIYEEFKNTLHEISAVAERVKEEAKSLAAITKKSAEKGDSDE